VSSITPQDPLDLKSCIDFCGSIRRYIRQEMPDDSCLAVTAAVTRYPLPLVKQVMKLDPSRFKPD